MLQAPGQSVQRYAHIVEKSVQQEQERKAWAAQHQPPPLIDLIDLTEDNDPDLQASRKARKEQEVGKRVLPCSVSALAFSCASVLLGEPVRAVPSSTKALCHAVRLALFGFHSDPLAASVASRAVLHA